MYVVRSRLTGKARTWCTSYERAHAIAAPIGDLYVHEDRGARHLYPDWRPKMGTVHPYDREAQQALQAEFEELKAAYLAGVPKIDPCLAD